LSASCCEPIEATALGLHGRSRDRFCHAGATSADVEAIYLEARRAGCKGITVYRYGTRPSRVLQRIPTDTESVPNGHAEP
jgi:hypothetical protein